MNPSRFWSMDRGDYVLLKLTLVLGPVLYAVYAVLPGLTDWVTDAPLTWSSQTSTDNPVAVPVPTLGGASVHFAGGVVWTIPAPTTGQRLLAMVPGLEVLVLVVLGCVCLWRLLTQLRSGDPFGGSAVPYVRALAVLVLCYALVIRLTRVLLDFFVTAALQPDPGAYFQITPGSLLPVVLGFLLLALAECFRQGARLRDDVEGLV